VHLGFPDPVKATGTEAERLAAFRQVRAAIEKQVLELLVSAESY
jgi:arsenate reductase